MWKKLFYEISDDDDDNILLSDLAIKIPTTSDKHADATITTTSDNLVVAPVLVSKIGMHCWDELIGELGELPHLGTIKYMA